MHKVSSLVKVFRPCELPSQATLCIILRLPLVDLSALVISEIAEKTILPRGDATINVDPAGKHLDV